MKSLANLSPRRIEAVDLFCGAGGLSHGLRKAGVKVVAGVDLDPACKFPFEINNKAIFIEKDIASISGKFLSSFYSPGAIKLLAGCAPCQPFSTLTNGLDTTKDKKWGLLGEFARIVKELKPELVTMENVPRVVNYAPYNRFVKSLEELGYHIAAQQVKCAEYGIPQDRKRFVLVASKLGAVSIPKPSSERVTVKDAIGKLPRIEAGSSHSSDSLHRAPSLTAINVARMKASQPGGTWSDWPKKLRLACHQTEAGASYRSVYGRMRWDKPSPTITTQAHNFGTGRFGHPEQDRAISLREAAILQSFSPEYKFAPDNEKPRFSIIGRLIGNAVPPRLGEVIGKNFLEHLKGC